ncbi:MAG: TonB-dependent receptor [Sphingomonas sp. SCN 67-18]|uniref:TonB-dependent receptor domain-containing protein n=1 Tax=uncultured Sphingomonas sp. TaxID=158754 RepID=UPI00086B139F|nr:TonB-dependent receptor [Sphingomonas sp. SCN 67-18]ODU22909.1 MAG: TonB-dependent receptor [Sphingomonas sp. SCN 67-18]
MRPAYFPAAAAMLLIAAPASAAPSVAIDLPAGTLGHALAVLGSQAGVSVSVTDAALWRRQVPAIKGRMTARAAMARLLRGTDAVAVPLDAASWRIVRRAQRQRPQPLSPRPAAPPQAESEEDAIIVTASKRDMRLDDYPGPVNLLGGAELAFGGERGTDAILSRVATISSTHLGAGRNKLFIRGIADSSFTGPTQATVGQYLGDIRLSYNAPDPDLKLYDIASVEVLEGPQGTLYGAGSLGGIIRIVRNAPHFDGVEAAISTGLSITQHGDPGGDLGGMVNLPLVGERAALRLVGYAVSDGGYIDDPAHGRRDINRTRVVGGRATLRIDIGDGWMADLGGVIQDTDGSDSQYADRDGPPLTRSSAVRQGFDAQYRLGEFILSKDWGDLRLATSTGIVGQTLAERYDATRPHGPSRLFRQRNDTALISNETRLWRPMRDGFGWVVGTSLLHNRTRLSRALGPENLPTPVTGVTNRITEATLYGEASIALLPGLTALVGGRLTHARLSGGGENIQRLTPAIEQLRAQIVAKRKESSVVPSVGLSAAVMPGLVLFTRYQQGFRPGGLAIENDFVRRFRNDRVATVDVGLRYGVPGRDAVDFSATLSQTRWHDIQADFIDAFGLPTTANIGDGRIHSIAATGGWRALAGLRLDFGVAFNDSRVTSPDPMFALAEGRAGRIPNVARFAGRVGMDYRTSLTDSVDLHVGGWARYVGRSRLGMGPVLGESQGDYLDTALTARIGRGDMGFTIGLTNLTDSVGNRFALGTPFAANRSQITPLRPRTLRIGFDAAF